MAVLISRGFMRVVNGISIFMLLIFVSPLQAISNPLSKLSHEALTSANSEADRVLELAKAQAKHPQTRQLAIDNLRNFLLIYPNNTCIKKMLIEALSSAGNHEHAIRLCGELRASTENDLDALLCHAKALAAHKEGHMKSVDLYEKYLELNPTDYAATNDFAEVLIHTGQKRRALTIFQKLILKEPDNIDLQCRYGQLLSCMGKLDDALRVYKEVLIKQPDNVGALIGAGVCSMYTCCPLSAEKYFKTAREKCPHDTKVLLLSAQNFRRMGRLDKARITLDQCLAQTKTETEELFGRSGLSETVVTETVVTVISHR